MPTVTTPSRLAASGAPAFTDRLGATHRLVPRHRDHRKPGWPVSLGREPHRDEAP